MRMVPSLTHLLLAGLMISCALDATAKAAPAAIPTFKLAALDNNNRLVLFNSDAPQDTKTVEIRGTDTPLTGIDVRPADRRLYGVSESSTLFVIDPATGIATRISKLTSDFRGGAGSGFDVNPQSDRLRLVAVTGLNMRAKIENGAAAIDGMLTYAPTDLHSGRRPAVTAAAYTNSITNARTTLLLVIDHELDILAQQDPPNDGVLGTIGRLGIDCGLQTGFDIVTDARGRDYAFLACNSELYRLNIKTGATESIGKIVADKSQILGLAVLPE